MNTPDFLIIGGGIMGLQLALELKRRHPDQGVTLLEKEPRCGEHASGRNSGVLHAGFYYTADSMKARFTRQGRVALAEYCAARGLRVNACGKLVVARGPSELAALDELLRRAAQNDVPLVKVTVAEAREIEPRVRTFERALWSPSTACVDPREVLAAVETDARRLGVQVRCGEAYVDRAGGKVRTTARSYDPGYVVNAAGLYADRVARDFGFSERYRILPFRGLYLYSDEPPGSLRTNVYPVPDLRNPFLGLHFTLTVDGRAKIGPTATPALWREQYGGLAGFRAGELADIVQRGAGLLLSANFPFRGLVREELLKQSRAHLVRLAGALVDGVDVRNFRRWGRPGMRAQLVDIVKRELEMDFVVEGDGRSMHVLNAVSPAFTGSIPFARYVCDRIAEART